MSDYLKTQENRLLASAKYIIRRLEERGYEAYIVGGCVRDSILGTEPHDYDICTSALPHEVMDAFDKSIVIPTGLKHGTVTIVIDGNNYEVTTFRIDGQYSDNRHPDNVEFTRSLIEDLKRRDFTMNALAYSDRTGLIDPFDGIDGKMNGDVYRALEKEIEGNSNREALAVIIPPCQHVRNRPAFCSFHRYCITP